MHMLHVLCSAFVFATFMAESSDFRYLIVVGVGSACQLASANVHVVALSCIYNYALHTRRQMQLSSLLAGQ